MTIFSIFTIIPLKKKQRSKDAIIVQQIKYKSIMSLEKERPPFGEPPYNSSSSAETSTTCIYDLFFDVPHPSASPTCERAKIIEPPGRTHPVISELYDPSNISRIAMFAFPDYDEHLDSGMFFCTFIPCLVLLLLLSSMASIFYLF